MFQGGIAFFDSGIGGLSVLRECVNSTRGLPIYYYGDNARAPYGNLPIKCIRAYAHEAFRIFERLNVAAAVVACNTVTALLIDELRACYSFPVIGIEPSLLPALKRHNQVLVLATNATVGSERFKGLVDAAMRKYPSADVRAVGCARLADGIERMAKGEEVVLENLLPSGKAEAVVLGCTHYSLVAGRIARFYGAEVFDGNQGVAARLADVLTKREFLSKSVEKNAGRQAFWSKLSTVTFLRGENRVKKPFKLSKKRRSFGKIKNAQSLYFLGSGRVQNCKFYERMFAFRK